MSSKLRVGIPLIGCKGWLGGVSYVENLIKALRMLPPDEAPLLYLIVTPDKVEALELHKYLVPLVDGLYSVNLGSNDLNLIRSISRNFRSYEELGHVIDFFFPVNSDVNTQLCSASWIPDFQHVHLPHLFSEDDLASRNNAFNKIAEMSNLVVFSSRDSEKDFRNQFPLSRTVTKILHFHTLPPKEWFVSEPSEIVKKYDLPDRFLLCCNQFWSHKNHALLFRTFANYLKNSQDNHLVCTGATTDYRSNDYFSTILNLLQELNIQENVHIMGTLPRNDQIQIMRQSLAVVQPSLFEGWSTVLEDARALGKTIILSDLGVHYEQAPDHAYYFDRHSIDSLQNILESVLPGLHPGPDFANEEIACKHSAELAIGFARNFMEIAHEACGSFITTIVEEGRSMAGVDRHLGSNYSKDDNIYIATSIAPKNIDQQKSAVTSWLHQGFKVISVNTAPEISILKPDFPEVTFVETKRDAREIMGRSLIFLDDVFAALKSSPATVCGIINSDIHLRNDIPIYDFVASEAKDSFICGHRYDVESLSTTSGKLYLNGYDIFFFDKSVLNLLPQSPFCLGATWWDIWVPLAMILKNVPSKRIIAPLGFHVLHKNRWDEQEWLLNSIRLVKLIDSNQFDLSGYPDFAASIKSLFDLSMPQGLYKLFRDFILEHTQLVAPEQMLPEGINPALQSPSYLVSAIVSTYNAEKFFSDCICNLIGQSLFEKGLLEIIIINSGSEQNEESIARYYMESHDHIVYQRTERETLYAAWNRGIKLAKGKYITHANTDDRHQSNAFERMAHALEQNDVGLVYVDALMTTAANENWKRHSAGRAWLLPDFNIRQALLDCPFGCQVMWRRSAHADVGMFDASYKRAGDYEFFLRLALKAGALHLPELLVLYHESPDNLSYQAPDEVIQEVNRFIGDYRRQLPMETIYPYLQQDSLPPAKAAALVDFANDLMGICGFLFTDTQLAEALYRQALEVLPHDSDILGNLIVACIVNGKTTEARSLIQSAGNLSPRLAYYKDMLAGEKSPELSLTRLGHPGLDTMQAVKMAHEIRVPWERPVVDPSEKTIIIDGVIFQLQNGRPFGISRMWLSLLSELGRGSLAARIILLDRVGTAPKIPEIQTRRVPTFRVGNSQNESVALDAICREEHAELFLSTYYTYTNTTPSLLMHYDMIPERFNTVGPDAPNPEWRDKYHAIVNSSAFTVISQSTARDLATFYPQTAQRPPTVLPCAVSDDFRVHSAEEIAAFKGVNGIERPYFLLVGRRDPHKNAALFFQAFARLPNREHYAIVMAGGGNALEPELRELAGPAAGYAGFFSDQDLSLAYSGAIALVYPSIYEGFGLPILEAMQSGCPVITCQNSSLPEVAGSAALYVGEYEHEEMTQALLSVQQPDVRGYLIKRGLERARLFSWRKSAELLEDAIRKSADASGAMQIPGGK